MTALIDTSFLFALTNRNDASHQACADVAKTINERLIVPITVLPEAAYLIDVRMGHHIMQQFVEQMTRPAWGIEQIQQNDLLRATHILKQYHDARLDFVDSTIIAVAERLRISRILTLDQRHFRIVQPRHCTAFELLPS